MMASTCGQMARIGAHPSKHGMCRSAAAAAAARFEFEGRDGGQAGCGSRCEGGRLDGGGVGESGIRHPDRPRRRMNSATVPPAAAPG